MSVGPSRPTRMPVVNLHTKTVQWWLFSSFWRSCTKTRWRNTRQSSTRTRTDTTFNLRRWWRRRRRRANYDRNRISYSSLGPPFIDCRTALWHLGKKMFDRTGCFFYCFVFPHPVIWLRQLTLTTTTVTKQPLWLSINLSSVFPRFYLCAFSSDPRIVFDIEIKQLFFHFLSFVLFLLRWTL